MTLSQTEIIEFHKTFPEFTIVDEHTGKRVVIMNIDYNNREVGYVCLCGGVHWVHTRDFSTVKIGWDS